MGITKHFTTMQSYLPKYPLVMCVSERKNGQPETALATVHLTGSKISFTIESFQEKLFSREIEQRNYFLRQRICGCTSESTLQRTPLMCNFPCVDVQGGCEPVLSLSVITHSSPDSHGNPKYFGWALLNKNGKKWRGRQKKSQKSHSFHSREWKSGCNGVEEVWNDRETERWMNDRRIWYMRGLDRGRTRWSHGVLLNLKLVIVGGMEQGREKSIG